MARELCNLGGRLRPIAAPARMGHPHEWARMLAALIEPGADGPGDAPRPDRPTQDNAIAGSDLACAFDLGLALEEGIEDPTRKAEKTWLLGLLLDDFYEISRDFPVRE